jgi:hypothetical protein
MVPARVEERNRPNNEAVRTAGVDLKILRT